MFMNNGINAADLMRMQRNFATEMSNMNTPASIGLNTANVKIGDFLPGQEIYKMITDYDISSTRSNIMNPSIPFELNTSGLYGIKLNTIQGFDYSTINVAATIGLVDEIISSKNRTTIYLKATLFDENGVEATQPAITDSIVYVEGDRKGRTIRVPLAVNIGRVTPRDFTLVFAVGIQGHKPYDLPPEDDVVGADYPFPPVEHFNISRFFATVTSFVRKHGNAKS